MKLPSVLAALLGLVLLGLAGCQLPPEPEPRAPRVYLMMLVPEGMEPQDLSGRREQIIRYLLESELLASRADLVDDQALADRIIRATLLDDGFRLEILNAFTGRAVRYEPSWMPDDYYYYEGLIFYGAAGSAYHRPHRDYDRGHPRPPTVPPGHRDDDTPRPPPAGTPGHPPRPPGHDRTGDHPRTPPPGTPPPRTEPRTDRPHSPLPPGPSHNRPKYTDDRPHRDDRPAPREHPRDDPRPKKDDDKPKPAEAPARPVQDQRPDNVPLR